MQIDPKGLEAAIAEIAALVPDDADPADDTDNQSGFRNAIDQVLAILSALSPAAPMLVDMGSGRRWMTPALSPAGTASEMEPVAWEGYWDGAGSISSETRYTRSIAAMERWAADGAKITPLWASHLVEEGSIQSDEYTELALALTAAEARASSAEAQLAEMREALRKIVSCYDRNWQHQREKLDDIVPMARAALEQSQ